MTVPAFTTYLLAADTPCVPAPVTLHPRSTLEDAADRLVGTSDRLRALASKLRRASIRWNIDSHPNVLDVPDLTRGLDAWPLDCGARWHLEETRNPAYLFPRVFVCTRILDHTGRHAAGGFGRITAVWGDD